MAASVTAEAGAATRRARHAGFMTPSWQRKFARAEHHLESLLHLVIDFMSGQPYEAVEQVVERNDPDGNAAVWHTFTGRIRHTPRAVVSNHRRLFEQSPVVAHHSPGASRERRATTRRSRSSEVSGATTVRPRHGNCGTSARMHGHSLSRCSRTTTLRGSRPTTCLCSIASQNRCGKRTCRHLECSNRRG
jgi:hypothetical protein